MQAMKRTPDGIWIEAPDAEGHERPEARADVDRRRVRRGRGRCRPRRPSPSSIASTRPTWSAPSRPISTTTSSRACGCSSVTRRSRKWQGEFSAVLVDEFQDIEPAQELLIQMLAAPEDLLFCVGDEDQCLYAWRRASVERVIELDQLYPGLERRALARNYRSPVKVVDSSRGLISRNGRRFPKQIEPREAEPGRSSWPSPRPRGAGCPRCTPRSRLRRGRPWSSRGPAGPVRDRRRPRQAGGELLRPREYQAANRRARRPPRLRSTLGAPGAHARRMSIGLPRPQSVLAGWRGQGRQRPAKRQGLRSGPRSAFASEQWRSASLDAAGALFDELARIDGRIELVHRLRTDGGLDRYYADAEPLNPTSKGAVDALEHAEVSPPPG